MQKVITEIYSRVAGYFRPVNQWNKGKQEEFKDRVSVKIPEVKNELSNKKIQV
jgi:anaerobic ribonucleoside-triphosphate reductase